MILYYAVGGGLGHLTRARAVVHTLGLGGEVALLTASPAASDRRVTGDLPVIQVPLELAADLPAYRVWLTRLLGEARPAAIYLDAFPAGILGELCDLPGLWGIPIHHLARLLRWEEYRGCLSERPPALDTTYLLEPLDADHEAYLRARSRQTRWLSLTDPPTRPGETDWARLTAARQPGRPLWLIVHAGMTHEVAELVAYATEAAALEAVEPVLAVVAPRRPEGLAPEIVHLDIYPAEPLFPHVERIITAAGFNSIRQTEPFRAKRRCLPFERRFDDQFRRAARCQTSGPEA